jgi:hypothetical protein
VTAALGVITRGTTARRRLRRVDAWLLATHPAVLCQPDALVVDLGFGASSTTTLELARAVHRHNAHATVVGLDIDPARVAAAGSSGAGSSGASDVAFMVGGFELAGLRPHLARALNVLRQYDADEVAPAWQTMTSRLAVGGLLVEGTCDETGRLGAWVTLDRSGPRTLTLLLDLAGSPDDVAARLPKALIHRNVPGDPVHTVMQALEDAWARASPLSVFSPRQRFAAVAAALSADGWPVLDGPSRWRRGELTLAWTAVAPGNRARQPPTAPVG